MAVTQFYILLENIPGTLAEISHRLGYAGINIRGISLVDKEDKSILRIVVNDPVSCERVFKEAGISYTKEEVLAVEMPNVPGALSECAKALGDANINIVYLYPFIARTVNAIVIFKTNKNEEAEKILKEKKGIKLLTEKELYRLE